jgi:hypothetical protein
MPGLTRGEVIRSLDWSGRHVFLTATQTIVYAAHEGRRLVMNASGATLTFTLPKCIGDGHRYYFVVGVVNTSNYVINTAVSGDTFGGSLSLLTTSTDFMEGFAASTAVTVTLNGDSQGGRSIGDWVEVIDISTTKWAIRGMFDTNSGNGSTPFS